MAKGTEYPKGINGLFHLFVFLTAELLQVLTVFKRRAGACNGQLQLRALRGEAFPLGDAKTNKAPGIR